MKRLLLSILPFAISMSATAQDATIQYLPPVTIDDNSTTETTVIEIIDNNAPQDPENPLENQNTEVIMTNSHCPESLSNISFTFSAEDEISIMNINVVNNAISYNLIAPLSTNLVMDKISEQLETQGWTYRRTASQATRGGRSSVGRGSERSPINGIRSFYACDRDDATTNNKELKVELTPIGRSFRYTMNITLEDIETVRPDSTRNSRSGRR